MCWQEYHLLRLVIPQNWHATKHNFGPSKSHEKKLARTGLWTLEDRQVKADLTEVYKIINGFFCQLVLIYCFNILIIRYPWFCNPYSNAICYVLPILIAHNGQACMVSLLLSVADLVFYSFTINSILLYIFLENLK